MDKKARKRYLLFQVLSDSEKLEKKKVGQVLFHRFRLLFGAFGLSQSDLSFLAYDGEKKLGVLRCSHEYVEHVRATLALTAEVQGSKARFHVVRVSGTLKTLKETALLSFGSPLKPEGK
ncbi:Rpp14/Pop5 family protein [Candidatus Hecatella orcuttiae]|jgi:RNase P/RNase MRP subunit POP5|uniref:Rpp14/Pop5 family protein n=1 Tax=Candidatus Hecatella orcuttiae TaxID=1935119 RepID=UPI002867F175|nr:Rpp14/Pop5 family protein [Candidatus Hecatella orcuttiae]